MLVLDWNLLENLLNWAVSKKMGCNWNEFPILLLDNPFWGKEVRERLVQLFFDKFDIPAIYLGKSPVMAAFAMGKHTALVIDCGASAISVTPVCEGYLIRGAMLRESLLGGDANSEQARLLLTHELHQEPLYISQQIRSKSAVELGQPAQFETQTLPSITESYLAYHQKCLMDDFKESIAQVSENPFNERDLMMRPPKFYEFPNGFNKNFGLERYRLGEQIFNPKGMRYNFAMETDKADGNSPSGLAEMINQSLQLCDVEAKGSLVANIILTGGGASMHGLSERLNYEMNRLPSYVRTPLSHPIALTFVV